MASTQAQTNARSDDGVGERPGTLLNIPELTAEPKSTADSGDLTNKSNMTSAEPEKQGDPDLRTLKEPAPPITAINTQPEKQKGPEIGAPREPVLRAPATSTRRETSAPLDGGGRVRKGTLLPKPESIAETKMYAPPDAGKQQEAPESRGEPKTQVVVAGLPTGWAAMAKTIKDVDEDKVKDYKDDIDTLLVFTGLFSAVLSAFVIVSIQMLSPDKQDTIILYLAQISNQTNSYTVTAGAVNSTIPPPLPSSTISFEPSLLALRVNYLWFSSLILTLVTASFAILVKQWLKEFLAYEYTSPHERLRARQFRYKALSTWKVYVIAGILPLLLQLALGLFFVGLCFFTQSDVHGIGTMCTVLVALWLGFFMAATVAPVFSPRCPYKTTLLKSAMIALRYCFRYIKLRFATLPLLSKLRSFTAILLSPLDYTLSNLISILSDRLKLIRKHLEPLSHKLMAGEESEIVKEETSEVSLLTEVDGLLLDDDLLGTTIRDALTQSKAESSDIIDFVVKAINYRLKGNTLGSLLLLPPDLTRMTDRGRTAVSEIVADAIKETPAAEHLLQNALYLLLSSAERALTENARKAIHRCIPKTTLSMIRYTLFKLRTKFHSDDLWVLIRTRLAALVEVQLKDVAQLQHFATTDRNSISAVVAFQDDIFAHPDQDSKTFVSPAFAADHPQTPLQVQVIINAHRDAVILHEIVCTNPDMITSKFESSAEAIVTTMRTLLLIDDQPLESSPSLLDLQSASKRVCELSSDMFGTMIQQLLVPGHSPRDIGSWLKVAIRILLSLPPSRLTLRGRKALNRLCHVNGPNRLYPLIRQLVSDHEKLDLNLSRLHELCQATDDEPASSLEGLFEKAVSMVISTYSKTHYSTLLAEHANESWQEHFVKVLEKRQEERRTRQDRVA